MTNLIDILISAKWLGGGALGKAGGDLRRLGDNAAMTSVEMAVARERAAGLNRVLSGLAEQVVLGNMTIEEATKLYEGFVEELGDVGKVAPKAAEGFGNISKSLFVYSAAAAAAVITTKKLFGEIKKGAELELVRQRFDRLAASIGTTGNALERDLRVSVRGLMSDTEVLAMATDLMAQGLATSHDEAVGLTGVAAELGFNMTQLVNTLTEQTTTQFDALGISIDGFDAKVRKLERAGYDLDQAFNLAFVEQAEEQIERVGSRADTTAGKIEQIENAWADVMDSMKVSGAEEFSPFIDFMTTAIRATNEAEAAVSGLSNSVGDYAAQVEAVERINEALGKLSSIAGQSSLDAQGSALRTHKVYVELVAMLALTGATAAEQSALLESLGFTVDRNNVKLRSFTVGWQDVYDAMEQLRLEEAQAEMNALAAETAAAARETADYKEELIELKEQVEAIEFEEMLEFLGMTNDEFTRLTLRAGGSEKAIEKLENMVKIATASNQDYGLSITGIIDNMLQFTQSAFELAQPLLKKRVDLWLDFQEDMTNVSVREGEKREAAEGRYEERRTSIVERYGLRRSQEEEDFARRRARSEARHLADIEGIREDATDRQLELRDRANQRLSDLERDHIDRMAEIVENADLQLTEAAGRLDAAAVASLTRQREDALQDERDSYKRNRSDIQRQLDEQLKAEREAAEERIAEMVEFHSERKRQEDEDRQIRLDRLESANREQLQALEDRYAQELIDIESQASKARDQKELQFMQDRTQLDDHYKRKSAAEDKWRADILADESAWWKERADLVGGGFDDSAGYNPNIPSQFLGGRGVTTGDININVTESERPGDTAKEVRDELLRLFGNFP